LDGTDMNRDRYISLQLRNLEKDRDSEYTIQTSLASPSMNQKN